MRRTVLAEDSVKTFVNLAELETAAGTVLGSSGWHVISQDQIDGFADVTGDHQWIHVDAERAEIGPYGGTVAHGFLILSLIPRFLRDIYRVESIRMGVNYGSNKVRFTAPVPVGSRVRGVAELVEMVHRGTAAQITFQVTVELAGSGKPACVAEIVLLATE
jgi:acyl dehydratase